ncbi:sulfatase-like hydrolase/transferase [Adhaeribacter swui]|uniref:Sulfatase-like hydrolase/transferase n=1 Tax=Adhaeribacter swui TaxID=2086471 RepID=A0A7G7GE57_9BACT|nr:sulfatase-like hydrolase/transferase [Adhaeribacter swui]QNF35441.1 sulfatase-like hydrolase/transferase [Adhaeribacter swui]
MFDPFLKIIFKRLGLLLLTYQLLRVAFFLANLPTFNQIPAENLFWAFVYSLRFDFSAILLINIPFLFFSLAPTQILYRVGYQKFLKILYFVVNAPFILLNLVDTEYFKFIGRRSTNEVATITQDILAQAIQLTQHYWYILLLFIILLTGLYFLYPDKFAYHHQKPRRKIWQVVVLTLATIILIRGGIQYKPIRVSSAFNYEPPVLGNLVLNSTFTFMRSLNKRTIDRARYFTNRQELLQTIDFDPQKASITTGEPVRDNVVILILESFGSEYTGIENGGKGYTPFFDSLATQGLFFRENYANGRRSIEALPSILSGLPSLMDNPFMASAYQGNEIYGIGSVLQPLGYYTSFYHGGANGTMSFNAFAKLAGFARYYGLDEYPAARREADFDGNWGIFDEPYLQYVSKQLTQQPQPFITGVFTLSAHHPYTLPAKYQDAFPKGNLKIHRTIGYTDFALKQFFKAAAKEPWYPNTLFVLTADHTQQVYRKDYKNRLGYHKVPLLFFHPGKKFAHVNTRKVTQHADIMPTLVDYLNVPTNKLLPFGKSVLKDSNKGQALIYSDGIYTLVRPDFITELPPDGETKLYKYKSHGLVHLKNQPEQIKKTYSRELEAYVQYFRNALLDNNLYFWLYPGKPAIAP